MEERRLTRFRFAGALAIVVLVAAACSSGGGGASPDGGGGESAAPGGSAPAASGGGGGTGFTCENIGGEVSVYGTWTGAEEDSFRAMVAPWEECSGAKINYVGQRDLGTVLTPLRETIFGLLMVGFLILEPRGLAQLWKRAKHKFSSGRSG